MTEINEEIISQTAGILLAAGRGRRMGCLKQLLPWRDSTVVASAFDGLAKYCGGNGMMVVVVVVDDNREVIAQALGGRLFHSVVSDSDAEQFCSILAGLREILKMERMARVWVHPADHPMVPALVAEGSLRKSIEIGNARALIPTYGGRGGHPVLIPRRVADAIVAWSAEGDSGELGRREGLRSFWAERGEMVERVAFDESPEIVIDLDTEADYQEAKRAFE